ncbi:uncharacterized protein RSE6_03673 [Rhynchosporium secalis]|uniref:Uncharacterized protein n=1 Tax=Rhynchosporium secalis TaxID=38038 RepID=A0A1E1M3C7_RHYSE|nr:uncharacterized protein RSE6_03673 [Rhynchosporium secalis]
MDGQNKCVGGGSLGDHCNPDVSGSCRNTEKGICLRPYPKVGEESYRYEEEMIVVLCALGAENSIYGLSYAYMTLDLSNSKRSRSTIAI